MDGFISPGTDRASRVRGAVERHLSNASASWQGGSAFGVIFSRKPGVFIDEAASIASLHVSMCVSNAPGITEGSLDLVIDGQPCQVTGPVTADASGWATFPIVFLN